MASQVVNVSIFIWQCFSYHLTHFVAVMKCEQPKKPRNGAVKVSDLSVNRTLVYTCSEKYKLEGPPSRVCSVDPQSMIPYWKPQLDANPAVCRGEVK